MSDGVPSEAFSRSARGQRQYDLVGGLVLLTGAAILLLTTFFARDPIPLTLRGAIIVFGAVSIAVAVGWLRVTNPQDFYGGMALIGLALIAFVASNNLPGMRGFAFGPGTAPRLFAITLILLSLGVVASGFLTNGPQVSRYNIRALIFVTGAILAFAATVRPLGLVIASFSSIVICAAATDDVKWRETVLWAAVLTAFCSMLFPYGLNLPFQLWPRFY